MGTMNNIVTFNISSPSDIALQIAARVKVRRLELDLTKKDWRQEQESSSPLIADLSRRERFH